MKDTPQIRRQPQIGTNESASGTIHPDLDHAETRDPLTYAIIGAAMKTHSELGPCLDEVFYHQLLSQKLKDANCEHQTKTRGRLVHRGIAADEFECDVLVASQAIAELKVLSAAETFALDHFTQIICYLKFWRVPIGLLLDFGKERLIYQRIAFTDKAMSPVLTNGLLSAASGTTPPDPLARRIGASVARVINEYGLGYRDSTYRGLLVAEMTAEGIDFTNRPAAAIRSGGKLLGEALCHCLAVENTAALMVLALRDRIATADRAIMQTYLKHLGLSWGLIVNFGKHDLQSMFVQPPSALNNPSVSPSHLRPSPNLRGT